MNAVVKRRRAEKDVCVRRQGGRCMGVGFFKQDSSFSQAVYVGCLEMLAAVAAQPVRTQCIDGDEEQIVR